MRVTNFCCCRGAIRVSRENHGGPGAVGKFEDAKFLIDERQAARAAELALRATLADGAFWRDARRRRLEAQGLAGNFLHGLFHLCFVVGVGPGVAPRMFGTRLGVGDGDGLLHVQREAPSGWAERRGRCRWVCRAEDAAGQDRCCRGARRRSNRQFPADAFLCRTGRSDRLLSVLLEAVVGVLLVKGRAVWDRAQG